MEVAVMGSRAKLRTKEGGKQKSHSSVGMNRMETEAVVQSGVRELLDWNDRVEVEAARAALFDRMKANDQR
jgi:hypothetical protein